MTARRAPAPAVAQPPAAHPFAALFSSPEFRAQTAERERSRAATRAAAIDEYGSPEAVFADTPMEAALRRACDHLREPGTDWNDLPKLAGWCWLDGLVRMPEVLRVAVQEAWPLPATVAGAWVEHEATSRLREQRYAFDGDWTPPGFSFARTDVIEDILDTLPARSLADVRARLSRFDEINDMGTLCQDEQRVRIATLRADIERMALRLRMAGARS